MSARSSSSTPQSLRSAAKSRLRQQIEMGDQRLHGGIEAVAFLELDGEAFGEIARAHAGRIEALQDREHGIDLGERRAELLGDRREIAAEIAGLVDQIDEVLPDHAAGRIGDRQRELLGEMVGERRLGRDEGLEIVVAVLAAAGAGAGPFGIARRHLGGGARGDAHRRRREAHRRDRQSRAPRRRHAGSPGLRPASRRRALSAAARRRARAAVSAAAPPRRRPRSPRSSSGLRSSSAST